jgi:hypothetical protein
MSCLLYNKKEIYISVQETILFLYYFLSAYQFLTLFSKVCSFLTSNLFQYTDYSKVIETVALCNWQEISKISWAVLCFASY